MLKNYLSHHELYLEMEITGILFFLLVDDDKDKESIFFLIIVYFSCLVDSLAVGEVKVLLGKETNDCYFYETDVL